MRGKRTSCARVFRFPTDVQHQRVRELRQCSMDGQLPLWVWNVSVWAPLVLRWVGREEWVHEDSGTLKGTIINVINHLRRYAHTHIYSALVLLWVGRCPLDFGEHARQRQQQRERERERESFLACAQIKSQVYRHDPSCASDTNARIQKLQQDTATTWVLLQWLVAVSTSCKSLVSNKGTGDRQEAREKYRFLMEVLLIICEKIKTIRLASCYRHAIQNVSWEKCLSMCTSYTRT